MDSEKKDSNNDVENQAAAIDEQEGEEEEQFAPQEFACLSGRVHVAWQSGASMQCVSGRAANLFWQKFGTPDQKNRDIPGRPCKIRDTIFQ